MESKAITRGLIVPLLVLLGSLGAPKAQNLCPNSSFESGAWAQANSGSADWLTASNVFGVQTPRSGSYMMGQAFGNQGGSNFREYIKCPLTTPMVVGNAYYLEMWVSLSDQYGTYACNHHGMALTTTSPYFSYSTGPIPLVPQVESLTPLTSQTTWMQVAGTVTATQAFAHLTVGNFYNDANTTLQFVGGNSFTYGYYFMDDMTVQLATVFDADFVAFDAQANLNGEVQLNWEVPTGTEGKIFEVQRSANGQEFEHISSLRLEDHPDFRFEYLDQQAPYNTDLQYRILQNDANGNIHYSDVKTLNLSRQGQPELLALYPSLVHASQPLSLEYLIRENAQQVNVSIVDMSGREVFQHSFEGKGGKNIFWVMPNDLAAGSYVMQISAGEKRDFARFQVAQ